MFSTILKHNLQSVHGLQVDHFPSLAGLQATVDTTATDYSLAVLDLNLPDAPNGEALDHVLSEGLPAIVFTGTFNDGTRDDILRRNVVDCVIKNEPGSIAAVTDLVDRTLVNAQTRVLLVDSNESSRDIVLNQLSRHCFGVEVAQSGEEALFFLDTSPTPDVIVTDLSLGDMTGEVFLDQLRLRHGLESVAIFGLDRTAAPGAARHFLQSGATEFLAWPLDLEEFNIRLFRIAEMQSRIRVLQGIASRDYLTDLYNRRFFYQQGPRLIDQSLRCNHHMSIAILDIDHFKRLNDTYGHEVGDRVLVAVARKLRALVSERHLLARLGGEEFAILFQGLDVEEASDVCNTLLSDLATLRLEIDDEILSVTLSAGLASIAENEAFDNYLHAADQFLYMAKFAGRNRLVSEATLLQSMPAPAVPDDLRRNA